MFQQFYHPHPALKEFVNNIMIHHMQFDANHIPKRFPVPPLPEHGLFFYVRDKTEFENFSTNKRGTLSSCIIVGPQVNGNTIIPGRNHLMIKVGFQPGGLYRFLGIPMNELLCNDAFNAMDFLGKEINEVNEKLQEATSFTEMKLIVEKFLLSHVNKLKQSLPIDEVLPMLIKQGGLIKIDQLASQSCLSIRQFERVFHQRIGLTPKYFSRLVRFAKAWIIKEQKHDTSWIKIAHECGYFDQMHLIRDFHEFTCVNPSDIESELLNSPAKFFTRLFY
ncbi:MAG: AraC family transcriptional regulator [Chitinophagaceae bacterium]|nr:AraC family transcriptional regulator [Chitinophagaceae bacterium]